MLSLKYFVTFLTEKGHKYFGINVGLLAILVKNDSRSRTTYKPCSHRVENDASARNFCRKYYKDFLHLHHFLPGVNRAVEFFEQVCKVIVLYRNMPHRGWHPLGHPSSRCYFPGPLQCTVARRATGQRRVLANSPTPGFSKVNTCPLVVCCW